MNIISKTIEYEYSFRDSLDDIILDMSDQVKNGFSVTMIDYSKATTLSPDNTHQLKVYFRYIKQPTLDNSYSV